MVLLVPPFEPLGSCTISLEKRDIALSTMNHVYVQLCIVRPLIVVFINLLLVKSSHCTVHGDCPGRLTVVITNNMLSIHRFSLLFY